MKEFDNRNLLKKWLHSSTQNANVYISKKEIRFAHLGVNIGFEQNGNSQVYSRPVLVLKKLWNVFWIVPMTTKGKESFFYHTLPDEYFWKKSRLILSQVRVIDKNRFISKIGKLKSTDFALVKKKLKAFLSL